MARPRTYNTLYERLVANTDEPENGQACWLWSGALVRGGYPKMSRREPGKKSPNTVRAHRTMLEEIHAIDFPLDEGGHLCYNVRCINPDHLEVETSAFNLSARRGYAECKGSMIPTLFPRVDALAAAAERAWDEPGEPADDPPF